MKTITFYLFLGLIAIFSSFGWQQGNETAINLILVAPFFLFFLDFLDKKPIIFPKLISLMLCLFLIFLSLGNFYSANFESSFTASLFYFSLSLFFVHVYNHKQEIKKTLPTFINLVALVLIITPFMVSFITKKPFVQPFDDKNLVFPNHPPHNHLGDFLSGVIVLNLFFLLETFSWKRLILILGFLPSFYFSSSRSAYVSLIVPAAFLIIGWLKTKKPTLGHSDRAVIITTLIAIILAGVFFISQPRPLLSGRPDYFSYALGGITTKPLTGYGLTNFPLVVGQILGKDVPLVQSAHNVFLNLFAETGLIAGGLFFLIFLIILIRGEKNAFWFIFLSLLVNFQIDYTYRIPLMLLLFFIVAGTVWKD